ncbi:MAG TPA: hypothetical protein VF121_05975 [Thermoanaerobaculia bacterium]|nr:hypothetical protein [Thermoanaerobaculia bacterium]
MGRLVLLWSLLATAACGTVKSPTEPAEGPAGPALRFAQIQGEIFTPVCAKAGCHDAATAQNGLVLEAGRSYALLVGHPALGAAMPRVAPGEPERSYLLKKLRGDPDISGDRMPLDGPPFLTAQQIEGIAGWIRAGAAND